MSFAARATALLLNIFFSTALRQTSNLKEAFLLARSLVSKRELRQGLIYRTRKWREAETWSLCSWPVGGSKALNAVNAVLKRDDTGVVAQSAGVCSATPELRISNAAAQTRIVSKARIRLDSRKSVRSFTEIICVDISEFESSHPSHAVRSRPAKMRAPPTTNVCPVAPRCFFLDR